MQLSIVFMAPFGSLSGANRSMLLLAERLAETERVCVVPLIDDPAMADYARGRGLDVRPVFERSERWPGRAARWLRAVKTLHREIRRLDAQIVLSNTARGIRFCWPAARLHGCRLVMHQRDTYVRNYFHLGTSRCDRIISISDYVKSALPKRLWDRTETIYNPIEAPAEDQIGHKATAGWTRGWPDREVAIGVAGLCYRTKGQDLLLRAAPALLERHPNSTFHIWGASERHSEPDFLKELKQLAEPIEGRVTFEPFRSDMETFYRQMDIVVQPSRILEGFGRVAAEAMAYGTPTVAAGHGGLVEIITERQTGWLHRPDDHEDLTRAILRILDDPAGAERVARAGRQSVIERFDPSVHAASVARLLRETVERNRSRPSNPKP